MGITGVEPDSPLEFKVYGPLTYDNSVHCLVDFDPTDDIYEERTTGQPIFIRDALRKCAYTVVGMIICGSLFAGLVSTALIYINLNILNLCDSTPWKDLPTPIQHAHVFGKCVADQIFLLYAIGTLVLAFNATPNKIHVAILYALLSGCVCTIYRLTTYQLHLYATSAFLGVPQYIIHLLVVVITPWILLSSTTTLDKRRKVKSCLLFGIQYFVPFVGNFTNNVIVLPVFFHMKPIYQSLMGLLGPFIGFASRTLCQAILLKIPTCFHPGNLYILYSTVHAVTILTYRIFQASVVSRTSFYTFGFVFAFLAMTERIVSGLYKKRIVYYLQVTILKKDPPEISTSVKQKRVNADSIIVGIVYEMWGIVVTNCMFMMYSIQHRVPRRYGEKYRAEDQIMETVARIAYSVVIECFSVYVAVFVLTVKCNIPINRLWHKKWRRIIGVLILNACFVVMLSSKAMVRMTENAFSIHLKERGDKLLARKLSMCNHTIHPY